jgi:P27 family predicted phage terminase small subunit
MADGRGRKARSSHLKALEGCREDRLNRDEPLPAAGAVVPPADLPHSALEIWNRLAPDLVAKKVLTCWDADQFANGCRIQAVLNEALAAAESEPLLSPGSNKNMVLNPAVRAVTSLQASLTAVWSRFGLTPADRAQLKVDDGGQSSGAEAYVV